MYACIFNLTNFVNSGTLYFKKLDKFDNFDAISLVLIVLGLIFYLFILFKYIKDPNVFGCFFLSFKGEKLAKYHLFLYIIVVVLSITLLGLFPDVMWFTLFCFFSMFVYVLTYRPFVNSVENYRSAFNFFVMCSWIGVRFLYLEDSDKMMSYYLLCINLWVLLPIVIIASFISTLCYKLYEKSNQNDQRRNSKPALLIKDYL